MTRRLAGGGIEFADAGEHQLKGQAGPARLWRVVRVVAGVGGAQRMDGLEAPLIQAADAAISEVSDIVGRLRCQPLLDRAAGLSLPESPIEASVRTAPGPEEPGPVGDG
jgi:hypothetical protein